MCSGCMWRYEAGGALTRLKTGAALKGVMGFSNLRSGQAAVLAKATNTARLTRTLAADARVRLSAAIS